MNRCIVVACLISLLSLPAVVHAQWNYTTNSGAITITGYAGAGGAETIPSTINGLPVVRIETNAFLSNTTLTSITVPASITNIGAGAFVDCFGLTAINVDAANTVYTNVAGVLFNKNRSTLIQCPAGKTGSYAIPSGVTNIGDSAFYDCGSLTAITITNSVISIGNKAFSFCDSTNLTSITIPNTVKSIGSEAFSFCDSLTNITFTAPVGVTNIGDRAFSECSSLVAISSFPTNLTRIGDETFNDCYSLTSVTIPKTVKSIGNSAFNNCSALTGVGGSLTFANATNIGDFAFSECSALTGSYTLTNALKRIGDSVFYDCSLIGGITFQTSSTLTNIGNSAFFACYTMTSFTIPASVTSIGDSAFEGCGGLTSITISNTVTSIGDGAFGNCASLAAINVAAANPVYTNVAGVLFNKSKTTILQCPGAKTGSYPITNTVTCIGNNAFYGCSLLANIIIPNGVTNVGDFAFGFCSALTNFTLPSSVTSIGAGAYEWTPMTNFTIPGSVTSIGDYTFFNCGFLASITIPNGVTNIGSQAFAYCLSLPYIAIPNSVTSIEDYAFFSCSKLGSGLGASLTIPGNVTSVGDFAFSYCTNLTGVYFGGNAPNPDHSSEFANDPKAIVYYLASTTGWGASFGGRPTAPYAVLTVTANPPAGGSASGAGPYPIGTNVQISATASNGWAFAGWSDANTNNPRTITMPSGGATYTANFQQKATITGQPSSVNVCSNATAFFSVTASGQEPLTYQWQRNSANLNNGGHYSGVTLSTLTVSAADGSVTGSYRCVVSNFGGSVTSAVATLTVTGPPAATGAVTGLSAVCSNASGVAYSITAVSNATGYAWTVPDGATVASGQSKTNITVNWGSASSGNVTVTPTNSCFSGPASSKAVTVTGKPIAGAISGPSTVCSNATGVAYSTTPVTWAAGYKWVVPVGATVASGQSTINVTVNWGTASSGNVTVTPTNSCFVGTTNFLAVTVAKKPAAAGAIAGPSTVCSNAVGVAYSIAVVSNATGYAWTVPVGATVASGQSTTNITVNWGSASSGNVAVTPTNSCFSGPASSKAVTVAGTPAAAGAISGLSTVCSNAVGVAYSIAAVSNATGYAWTVPAGATVASGQSTTNVTVNWGSASSGNVTVTPTNSTCSGTASSKAVTVIGKPVAGVISGLSTVCSNAAGVAYSITAVSNATGYAWTVPAGATLASGQSTTNITVNWGSASSGNVTVTPTNSCFVGPTNSLPVTVSGNPVAGALTGSSTVCSNASGVAYSIASVSNATGYVWTVPAGATVASGQSTTNITVNWGSASSGNVTVTPTNSACGGLASSLAVTVTGPPSAAGLISGLSAVCSNTSGVAYSIAAVSGATGYAWTVPAGATVAGGQNTTAITVNWGSASSGSVTVTPTNSCFSAPASSLPVTVTGPPSAAGSISGLSAVCSNTSGVAYSIAAVSGATGYNWAVPAGATVASGQNTTNITVNWGSASSGNVTVTPTNSCFSGPASSLPVIVTGKPVIGPITGSSTVCSNAAGIVYSIAAVSGATGYNWGVPSGATVASGQGTTAITVNWSTASSGNVTVTPTNSCFNGTAGSLAVTVTGKPAAAGVITGSSTVCSNAAGIVYSIAAVSGATGYNWGVPAGATVASGQGTTAISVNWGPASPGNVTVTPTNSCFSGTASSLAVTVTGMPGAAGAISGLSTVCSNASGVGYSIVAVSGAAGFNWAVPAGATVASGQGTTAITVNWGMASSGNVTVQPTNSCFSGAGSSLSVTVNSAPSVNSSPTNLTVCAGALVSFNATASGVPAPGVQWQRSTDNGTIWSGLGGATNLTYSFAAAPGDNGHQYRAAFSNDCGTVTSAAVTLTVQAGQLSVSPAAWDFGSVLTAATTQISFTITNAGCGQLSGTATTAVPFAVVSGSPYTLPGFGTTNVIVSFAPVAAGWFTNDLVFESNGGVITNTITGEGLVQTAPVALFSALPTNGVAPLVVVFTDQSTGTITNRLWDFGDGTSTNTTATSLTNTYPLGTYSVTLTTFGPLGIASTNTQITVVRTLFEQWQLGKFGCVECPQAAASADPDGDGMNNVTEFLAGFSPNNSAAYLHIISLAKSGANALITYLAAAGDVNGSPGPKTNVLEYAGGASGQFSNNFVSTGWTNILTGGSGLGTVVVATDTNGASSTPARYYRVRVLGPATVAGPPGAASAIVGASTVCSNASGVAYSIAAVSNATGYAWTVPAGATVASGQSTINITVNWGTASSGSITVTPTNSLFSGTASSLAVTITGVPAAAGAITGASAVCSNASGVAYSIAAVGEATGYEWIVPAGATVASGQGTTAITVDWGTAASGNVTVTPTNSCFSGPASSLAVTVIEKPVAGAITGFGTVCSNASGVAYSILVVSEATGYEWTVPAGATVASGQGTTAITVDWGTATSGSITVTPTNDCFSGAASSLPVTVTDAPEAAGAITGASAVCSNISGVLYSIAAVTGATGYEWTLPAGATVASGQGTTTITVDWGTASSGNVRVAPTNSCFSGPASLLAVTVIGKPVAGAITGLGTVCSNASSVAYSVALVSGATGYNWTVPAGATVASGQGTTAITVDWGTAASGNATVTPTNDCFSGAPAMLAVTVVEAPEAAGVISGSSTVCSNASGVAYSVPAVSGATGYNWTVPAGATVASGQGTTAITVDWVMAASGDVTVTPTNSCFSSPASSLAVTVNVSPSVSSSPTNLTVCAGALASFSATASGAPVPSVQWQRSTDNGTNWNNLAGETNLTYSFNAGLGDEAHQYRAMFSNDCGTVESAAATLTVLAGQLGVSPVEWNIGPVATGATVQVSFTITNAGCGQLSGSATSGAPFAVVAGSPFTLPGFGATNVMVSFTPPAEGWFTNEVIFGSDGGVSTNRVIGQGAIAPVALFSASPTNGVAPLVVAFTDGSTGTITNRFWDFGDGSSTNITATSVTNTYAAGSYTVTLIVNGPLGIASTNTLAIVVITPFQQWQMDNFGCLECPQAAAAADPDGDGMNNTNEFLAGFKPTDSAAYLHIISLAKSGSNELITYLGAAGDVNGSLGPKTNVLEYTVGTSGRFANDFTSTGWTNILSGGSGTGTVVVATDTNGATSTPGRYYRIRVLLP